MRFLIDSSASTKSARHCCWHRNFQLSTSICHDTLQFIISKFNSENTTQSSGIIEFWLLDGPLFLFALRCIWCHISGHTLSGLEVVCFLVSLSLDHVYPSSGFSFSTMNLVKSVHTSEKCLLPSTFQLSSICLSDITTKMYR